MRIFPPFMYMFQLVQHVPVCRYPQQKVLHVRVLCIAVFSIALSNLPQACSAQGLRILGQSTHSPPDDCVTIVAGLPPIPAKLVSRIEVGEYIDI